MRILGAILAGGRSQRFGSDKALALIEGRPMLDHVADRLRGQCEALVMVGRDWPGTKRVDDLPEPGLGPLGGLAGALAYAEGAGFDAVLTSSCDLPALPRDLLALLGTPDALLQQQPTIGLWSADRAALLNDYLASGQSRSVRAWADRVRASAVVLDTDLANINTPEDMASYHPHRSP